VLEAVQGRIERTLLHLEHVARQLPDAFGDRPAMERLECERLQNEQVERSLDEIDGLRGRLLCLSTRAALTIRPPGVDNQGESP
jgi:hypothetical protein